MVKQAPVIQKGRGAKVTIQDLKAQIDQASSMRDEKAAAKAKSLQANATAEGGLQDTISTRDADQKYLGDLTATGEQEAPDFEGRRELRAGEIEAIEKAIETLSSAEVRASKDSLRPSPTRMRSSRVRLRRSRTPRRRSASWRASSPLRIRCE